jgi:beta-lactam-binding protein with PASTA domain
MNQVFLSYASEDRERARRLADAMTGRGYRVWWDRQIVPGQTFDEVIEQALDESGCVVVLWSSASVKSQWVKTEAAEAASRRILVPVRIDDVKIPLEFRRLQAADLTQWNGDAGSPEFAQFLHAVDHELLEHREALAEAPTMIGRTSGAVESAGPSTLPQAPSAVPQAVIERSAPTPAQAVAERAVPAVPSRGRGLWIGASLAVVVLAGAAVAWLMMGRDPAAPHVAGMSYEQAVAAVTAAGLAPERRERPSTTDTPGQVVAQSPAAGTRVTRGSVVSLTVAIAAPPAAGEADASETAAPSTPVAPVVIPRVTIPDLRGQTPERAAALLAAAELAVGATTEVAANDVALGTIVSQDPAASQTSEKGSPVRITVAVRRTTPELTGLSLQQAREQLAKLGLSPGIERVRAGRREPDDRVLRQSPAAGSEIAAGGEVAMIVATAAPKRVNAGEPLLYTTPRQVPDRCAKACQELGLRWTREWSGGQANTCTCDLPPSGAR